MPFLMGTILYVQRLAEAFAPRTAGRLYRTHGEARLFRRAVPLLADRAPSRRLPPVHRGGYLGGARLLTRCNPGPVSTW